MVAGQEYTCTVCLWDLLDNATDIAFMLISFDSCWFKSLVLPCRIWYERSIYPKHELTVLSDINWLICSFGQQIQQSFFPFLHSFWKWSSSGWVLQYFTQLFFFFSFYFRRNWMTKDIVILLPKRWMILLLFQYLGLYSAPQLLKLSLFVFIITWSQIQSPIFLSTLKSFNEFS